jgi:hypothetical protein
MAQTKVKLISDGVIVQGNLHASHGITTADIGEGSNLYYTDARVGSYLSTNSFATESYVGTQIANLVDSSPSALNTLNELAAALGDDANFSTTVTNSIALKAPLASPSFTGNVGIGTTNSSNRLAVSASNTGTQITTIPVGKFINTGNSFSKLIIGSDNANFDGVFSMDNDSTLANTKLRIYIGNGTNATSGHSNDQIVLQGDGNVGIGTDSPDVLLQLRSNINTIPANTDFAMRSGKSFRFLGDGDGNADYGSYIEAPTKGIITIGTRWVGGDEGGLTVNRANVGIGTTSPTNGKLEVQQTATTAALWVQTGGTTDSYTIADFRTGTNASALAIKGNGNVGIGTTTLTNSSGYNTLSISGSSGGQIAFQTSGTGKHFIYSTATDLAFYNGQAGNLIFYTDGSNERMRITSGGNIGISGNTSAWSLGKTIQINSNYGTINYNGVSAILGIVNAYYNGSSYIRQNVGYAASIDFNTAISGGGLAFRTENSTGAAGDTISLTTKVAILSNGNVGIGTTVANGKLHIADTSSSSTTQYFSAASNTATYSYIKHIDNTVNTSKLTLGTVYGYNVPVDAMTIFNGNVGIGTDSPTKKLTVNAGSTSGDGINITGSSSPAIYINETSGTVNSSFQNDGAGSYLGTSTSHPMIFRTANTERMRVTSGGNTLIGITTEQNAGRLQIESGTSENGGILDIAGGGWYRYYTRVCRNATSNGAAGYWHIKTNIAANSNTMFLAKFYGYIYGSAQIVDLTHAGYAYSGTSSVINQAVKNNGTEPNASSAVYISASGSKVTFRIAFGTGSNFSTYFAGVFMDIAFPSPAGQGIDFEIEAQSFSTSTTVY